MPRLPLKLVLATLALALLGACATTPERRGSMAPGFDSGSAPRRPDPSRERYAAIDASGIPISHARRSTAASTITAEARAFDAVRRFERRYGLRVDAVQSGVFTALGVPFGSFAGDVNLGKGFSAGPIFAFGYSNRWVEDGVALGLWSLGLHGSYHFSHHALSDSWFLRGHYVRFTANASNQEVNSSGQTFEASGSQGFNALGATVGYHWFWKSGFNLSLGLGLVNYSSTATYVRAEGIDPSSGAKAGVDAELPLITGRSIYLPMPEITLGWSL